MKLPTATKYEVQSNAGLYATTDAAMAIANSAQTNGVICAIDDCVGRVAGAHLNGVPLSAKQYQQYLDLSDGGRIRDVVDGARS